ncbi:biosynthetic peptidoglycan transglycosylase [Pedobacter glucosidilyticus]|uniref:biosynthetic peptidoglycan transglycosylase n=1 Tax=Pedobacter glucosidilyticus TaxID=1122941 RepID=UPI0026EAD02C|nr:biosynthetic peptidoglycan transglycosylase [Pedobacter glucosidilyticus]
MRFLTGRFKQFKHKKTVLIALSVVFLMIVAGGIIAYLKREALLEQVVNKAVNKAKSKYNLNVKIGSYAFSGLSTVHFSNITVIPEERDSLANITDFTVGIKLFPLLFGDIKISELKLNHALISLVKRDSISNYDFLFKKDTTTKTEKKEVDLADLAHKLIHQALDKIPDDMAIQDFKITYKEDTTQLSILTKTATIIDNDVKSTILINDNLATWHVDGTAEPSDQQLDLKLYANNKKVEFPYLENKYGLKLNFDTVRTVMSSAEKSGSDFEITGNWSVKNLLINHPKIAANDIIVPDGSLDAKLIIGKNSVAVDSSSVVHLGKASIHPFVKLTLGEHKIYELKLNTEEQDAQEIFNAFPHGLFESLEGMQVKGKLKYDLNFYLDSKKPDDVVFSSSLTASPDFKITRFGKTNFQKINKEFVYTPYEKGKPVRNIIVGPQNPNYVPIQDISPNIKNALLTSEDPSFYSHNGFVEESIRQSIATNFKAKSFKRGGSTISMQLVKNIYLNRQKTLARKIEEILIVWLIEHEKLSSKNRMYEVYLNIIEWGRNVYGISEAANYYFGKHPSQLSIGEAIYLAYIVPKPKSSLYAWQADGSLKPYLRGYFNLIGGLMARRGYTQADSSVYGYYGVRLRESLRLQIAPSDTIPDSLAQDDEANLFNLFKIKKDTTIVPKEKFLKQIFEPNAKDTTTKSAKELRQERRQKRKQGLNN